ncbi:MAG TPA: S9 family peptidase [Caulobacteraceae bacterium]|nr:S9 family peptidase [Caulobacteraceae bacterium]
MRGIWFALALLAAGVATAASAGPPPLRAYGDLPGVEAVALSPSGDRYAIVGAVGEARKLAVVGPDGKPMLVGNVGDAKIRRLEWAGEDKVVAMGSGTYVLGPNFGLPKYEIGHAIVVDVKTREVRPLLTKGAAGNGTWGEYGFAQQDGRWYGYFGAITLAKSKGDVYFFDKGQPDLYRVDLDTGGAFMIARGAEKDGTRRDWLVSQGAVVATHDFDTRSGEWRIRAGETGPELGRGVDRLGDVELISGGRAPGTVIFDVPGEDERSHWMEAALAGGAATEILAEEPILETIVDRRTGLLLGYVRDADQPKPVLFDPVHQARVNAALKPFANRAASLESWNDAFDRLIVRTSGVADSGSWWLVDINTLKAEQIGYSYPMVKPEAVGPMRTFKYAAADGLELEGVLTLPPDAPAKNLPLVVLPHGGPAWRDYPEFDWWAQAFASGGYAVFQPNFRGSTGYGRAFRNAGEGEWGAKMQTDISDGVAALAREGIVNPRRACIVGASYGGYAALAGVTIQNGLYRCAVSVNGVSDLPGMLSHIRHATGRAGSAIRSWKDEIGEDVDPKSISPSKLADRADAPVLLIHGRDDTVVPYDQSKTMERALKSAGKPVELVTLKGEDHWLSRGDTRLQMLQAAVAFVEKHNPVD